jgi:NAD(P)-dependent dehydrogenase (short-subunit alcohol dehydrogenase family)
VSEAFQNVLFVYEHSTFSISNSLLCLRMHPRRCCNNNFDRPSATMGMWKAITTTTALVVTLLGIILAVPHRDLDYDKVIIPMAQRYAGDSNETTLAPLSDTIVVVTGATSGVGLALTRALSKMGAQVVALGRSSSKLANLKEELPSVQTVKVDLSDLESVSQAADQLIASFPRIDILVNNGGMHDGVGNLAGSPPNPQGYDYVFAVNYLSHFLLTEKLSSSLSQSTRPVILQTSSSYHWGVDGSDLLPDESESPIASQPGGSRGWYVWRSQRSYANSKLAQIYHARSLKARHPDLAKARIVSVCPGWVATSIAGKGSFGDMLMEKFAFPMEGWGIASALHAMFEDTDEDYYINTQGFKAFEYLFADLPSWFYQTGLRDLVSLCSAFLGLIVQRVVPYAGHPGVSSPESYNATIRDTLYDWSQNAVAKYL